MPNNDHELLFLNIIKYCFFMLTTSIFKLEFLNIGTTYKLNKKFI